MFQADTSSGSCKKIMSTPLAIQFVTLDSLFPHKVSREAQYWHKEENKVEHSITPQTRDDVLILSRETDRGSHDSIQRQEKHCEDEGSGNC